MGLLDKIIFIADNLDAKEGSVELLEQIKSGQVNADDCIEIIIEKKLIRNKKRGVVHNPFLDITNEKSRIRKK